MLRIDLSRERRWVSLACGIELLVDPLTTAIWTMAANDAAVLALPDDAPRDLRFVQMTAATARLVVRDWRGVADLDGADLPVTDEAVGALMDLATVSHEFAAAVITPYLLMLSEKKGYAPSPTGISAGAPDIALPAMDSALTAPDENASR